MLCHSGYVQDSNLLASTGSFELVQQQLIGGVCMYVGSGVSHVIRLFVIHSLVSAVSG